jgi:hypothetical protein
MLRIDDLLEKERRVSGAAYRKSPLHGGPPFWLLGEYADRIPVWGSQAMPTDYLRRQVTMLRKWETLELPL